MKALQSQQNSSNSSLKLPLQFLPLYQITNPFLFPLSSLFQIWKIRKNQYCNDYSKLGYMLTLFLFSQPTNKLIYSEDQLPYIVSI
ncbi:unnamed protein product [Paramecium sonneborni]|uniref:Uncharacterized protein n=1 Tax=Paramecium sonneborni TaxID=65129 RepID=A0A8S1RAZ9_9CILI|nr:unnamed protein product [Paramecium sonneborni]